MSNVFVWSETVTVKSPLASIGTETSTIKSSPYIMFSTSIEMFGLDFRKMKLTAVSIPLYLAVNDPSPKEDKVKMTLDSLEEILSLTVPLTAEISKSISRRPSYLEPLFK